MTYNRKDKVFDYILNHPLITYKDLKGIFGANVSESVRKYCKLNQVGFVKDPIDGTIKRWYVKSTGRKNVLRKKKKIRMPGAKRKR